MKILDACCGSKMFWFNREHEETVYMDNRTENTTLCDGRKLIVKPDVIADFRKMPFENESFHLVVFDPPHLVKAGEAELARAEQNRQVAVLEAKAKLDSAESLAQAEVKRAEGTAKANQIIGQSLKGNEAYIHWLWVDTLKDSKDQIIYIPTEAGVPITESFRLKESK